MRPLVIAIVALVVGGTTPGGCSQFENRGGMSNATQGDASPIATVNPTADRGETNSQKIDWLAIKATSEYTEALRHERVQGTMALQVAIQPDGTTGALEVTKTSGDVDLDRRAFEAAKTWRFKPATGPDGAPILTTEPIEITFRIR